MTTIPKPEIDRRVAALLHKMGCPKTAEREAKPLDADQLLSFLASEIESAKRLIEAAPIWDHVTRIKLHGRIEGYVIVRTVLLVQSVNTEGQE